jgi:hypothetical protein
MSRTSEYDSLRIVWVSANIPAGLQYYICGDQYRRISVVLVSGGNSSLAYDRIIASYRPQRLQQSSAKCHIFTLNLGPAEHNAAIFKSHVFSLHLRSISRVLSLSLVDLHDQHSSSSNSAIERWAETA